MSGVTKAGAVQLMPMATTCGTGFRKLAQSEIGSPWAVWDCIAADEADPGGDLRILLQGGDDGSGFFE